MLDPTPAPADVPDDYGNPDPEWLGIDWREHLRRVEVLGSPVNYVEAGPPDPPPGVPLVFVHGLSGAWQNFLEQIPAFSGTHRVFGLDLPGFGASPVPEWELSIRGYGCFLCAFLDAVGIERCALVGNSMGGFIAAEVAISEPDRVERLALVSAAGISHAKMTRHPAATVARFAAAASPLAFGMRERTLRRPGLRRLALGKVFYDPAALRPEILWENLHAGLHAPGFLAAVEGIVGYDFTDRLPEIEVPVVIVWGRHDQIVPPRDGLEFERLIGDSSLVVFDRCGHLPQLERPARFNALLQAFLSR